MKHITAVVTATLLATVAVAYAAGMPAVPSWGVDLSMMDRNVKPGDDFFLYANGNWLKKDTIPEDRSYSGVNLELDKSNDAHLQAIVASLHTRSDLSAEETKLRDLYDAYEDAAGIEANGLKPAQADLARIAGAKSLSDIAALMGDPALGLDGPFSFDIQTDQKNPDAYAVYFRQSGLGMGDRDYYLKKDKDFVATQAAYKKFLVQMLGFAGAPQAEKRASAIYKLEYAIAQASWPAEQRRDAVKTYNPLKISALSKLVPKFPWAPFWGASGLAANSTHGERMVIVAERSAFPKLAAVFAKTPVAVWRDYLTVRYLHHFAPYLPKQIDDANFAFYGTVLQGQTQQLDRPTRGVHLLDDNMGEALGKLYVAKYFPPEAKAKAETLVRNILAAYDEDIKTLAWMSPETRSKARDKLAHYRLKIGYPDHWRDYSPLAITRSDLIGDMKAVDVYEWHRELDRIDLPVDKTEWGMTPPTNNAYYDPTANEIVFPAGILQPPFFDPNADDAVNYGEIGATIGHEISHGFDDQGSKYDALGALRDWWTPEDRKAFDARTLALANQYDQYEPLPGLHIKGRLTLGENIADLAGLVIAFKAYHIALGGKPAPVLDGYTGDQRFYIAYSQSWRQHDREGWLRQHLVSNPHSPESYRVNGVVRNDDGWYASFPDIKPGDKYWLPPEQRVHLW